MALSTVQQNSSSRPGPTTVLTSIDFLNQTKSNTSRFVSNKSYVDGGTTTDLVPQQGLGAMLWYSFAVSIVVGGTVSSGNFKSNPYPVPYSLIKNFRFGSNNGTLMRNLTGWAWYKWASNRYGLDPTTSKTSAPFRANNLAAIGATATHAIVAGAAVVAQTYTANFTLPMPIAFNQQAETGLLLLQQESTFFSVQIDWGQVSGGISATGGSNDFFSVLVGTSLVITPTITYTVGLEWFNVIAGVQSLVGMFMSVISFTQPFQTGTVTIPLPANEYYTLFHAEFINNGAPVAVANLTQPTFSYSGNQYQFIDDYITRLVKNMWQHDGLLDVDGSVSYDLGLRMGNMDHRDWLDAFDNRSVTNAQINVTVNPSLSVTAPSQIEVVTESLRYVINN